MNPTVREKKVSISVIDNPFNRFGKDSTKNSINPDVIFPPTLHHINWLFYQEIP